MKQESDEVAGKQRRKRRNELAMYEKVAYDIANRIASGDIAEGRRLSGRSLMSSEYGVSPETIRRAFSLLEEMQVVTVLQNSGVRVLSREHAAAYLTKQGNKSDTRQLLGRLKTLVDEHEQLNREMFSVVKQLVDSSERFVSSNPFYTYECTIPDDSSILGASLNDLNFWHRTHATVIAVRREGNISLSPGPQWILQAQDVLVLVGNQETRTAVELLIQ
jgi:K+/H+ antiporter YhaU regulatory subunit KhtT